MRKKLFFLRFFGEGQTVSYLCTPKTKTGDQIWKRDDCGERMVLAIEPAESQQLPELAVRPGEGKTFFE